VLRRVRTYERAGHRYSLYEGGSWALETRCWPSTRPAATLTRR